MNREQKLALVIGFALVLVVGVLISDHYSSVQQPRLEGGSLVAPPLQALADSGGAPLPPGWSDLIVTEPGTRSNDGSQPSAGESLAQASSDSVSQYPPFADQFRSGRTPPPAPPALGDRNRNSESQGSRFAQATPAEPDLFEPVAGPVDQPRRIEPLVMELGDGRDSAASSVTRGLIERIRSGMAQLPVAGEVHERPAASPASRTESTIPAPAPSSAAPASLSREHYVQPNESLYKIAERAYGQGRLWRQLAEANPGKVGKNGVIRPGVRLVLPAEVGGYRLRGEPQARSQPETRSAPRESVSQPKTYTVAKGDTLSQIAQRTLGSSRRMNDIIEANRNLISDADEIRVGMKLTIPSSTTSSR